MGSWRSLLVTAGALLVAAGSAEAEERRLLCGGTWGDPASWSPPGVPGPTSDVVVECGSPVTVPGIVQVATLRLTNGILSTDASTDLTVTGSATVQGTLHIAAGTLRLAGPATFTQPVRLGGQQSTLVLGGAVRLLSVTRVGTVDGLVQVAGGGELLAAPGRQAVAIEGRLDVDGLVRTPVRVSGAVTQRAGTISAQSVEAASVSVSGGTYAVTTTVGDLRVLVGELVAVGAHVYGDLTLTSASVVRATVAVGAPPLTVTGRAIVAGRLQIDPLPAIVPGSTPVLVASAVSGSFQPEWPRATTLPTSVDVTYVPVLRPPTAVALSASAPRAAATVTARSGTWDGDPTFSYSWLRCRVRCVVIPDADDDSYVPTRADVGARLAVRVTAANEAGETVAESPALAVQPARALVRRTRPSLLGSPTVGTQVRCLPGRWSGSPQKAYTFAWLRDDRPLAGARRATRLLAGADAGHRIACRVTVVDRLYGGRGQATTVARLVRTPPS